MKPKKLIVLSIIIAFFSLIAIPDTAFSVDQVKDKGKVTRVEKKAEEEGFVARLVKSIGSAVDKVAKFFGSTVNIFTKKDVAPVKDVAQVPEPPEIQDGVVSEQIEPLPADVVEEESKRPEVIAEAKVEKVEEPVVLEEKEAVPQPVAKVEAPVVAKAVTIEKKELKSKTADNSNPAKQVNIEPAKKVDIFESVRKEAPAADIDLPEVDVQESKPSVVVQGSPASQEAPAQVAAVIEAPSVSNRDATVVSPTANPKIEATPEVQVITGIVSQPVADSATAPVRSSVVSEPSRIFSSVEPASRITTTTAPDSTTTSTRTTTSPTTTSAQTTTATQTTRVGAVTATRVEAETTIPSGTEDSARREPAEPVAEAPAVEVVASACADDLESVESFQKLITGEVLNAEPLDGRYVQLFLRSNRGLFDVQIFDVCTGAVKECPEDSRDPLCNDDIEAYEGELQAVRFFHKIDTRFVFVHNNVLYVTKEPAFLFVVIIPENTRDGKIRINVDAFRIDSSKRIPFAECLDCNFGRGSVLLNESGIDISPLLESAGGLDFIIDPPGRYSGIVLSGPTDRSSVKYTYKMTVIDPTTRRSIPLQKDIFVAFKN